MKKALSLLLCLCLLTSCFVMLIPTASAAVTSNGISSPRRFPKMRQAELIYSESFESENVTGATDASALIEALGWTGTAFSNMAIQQDSGSDNHQLYFKANNDSAMTVCTDDRLVGGNYVIEYTATMLTFANGADGAGMGFRSSYKEETAGWNFLAKERGNFDFHFHTSTITADNYHEEVDIAPTAETVSGTKRTNGSIVGEKIRFRLVIDAENGLSAYTVDQTTGEATIVVGMNEDCVASWANSSSTLNNTLMIRAINIDTSYLVDDIQIWSNKKSAPVPRLIGYQTTAPSGGTYDVRFLAGIRLSEGIDGLNTQSLGFRITHSSTKSGTTKNENLVQYSPALYKTLSDNFGTVELSAVSQRYDYLVFLTVKGISTDAEDSFTITPFSVIEEKGSTVRRAGTAKTFTTNGLLDSVPAIAGGRRQSEKEFTTDYYRHYYTGTALAEYNAYTDFLTAAGYTLFDHNTIGNNVYKTYVSDEVILHAYYLAATQTSAVLVAKTDDWTAYPTSPTSDGPVAEPNLMMMDMSYLRQSGGKNNGMGFVYTLEDGSYVIIDGGWRADAAALYSYLRSNNKRADGKILIRAWFITHPDQDHYGCFLEFTGSYADQVTLEYFVAQFEQSHITTDLPSTIRAIDDSVSQYENCETVVPMAGQVMYFGTLKVEFFFTAEMYQGYTGVDLTANQTNESSLVFKAYLGDTEVLFTADVMNKSIDALVAYYGNSLRCQYFQAPHHGLNGTTAFFDAIRCEYLFMTTHATATAERLDSTHAHGKQSKLYYLVQITGMNPATDVFSAGEKDSVTGDELTVIPISVSSGSES